MSKIDKIKLSKIVLDTDINKKFLDFEHNQDLFYDRTKNAYYSELYNYIGKLILRSNTRKEMLLNKSFVSNLIRLIKSDSLVKTNSDNLVTLELIHYLYEYYETLNIIKLESLWPYTEEDKSIRKEATSLLELQISQISRFLEILDYKNKLSRVLEDFSKRTNYKRNLTQDEFNELSSILYFSHSIPQNYVDLYLENILKYHKKASSISLKNVLSSLVENYALSHDTYCFLDIDKLNPGVVGSYDNHVITLSERTFNDLYSLDLSTKRNVFDTIFHELTHLIQEEKYKKVPLHYEYILMLKDTMLSNLLKDEYTTNNYKSLYNEVHARKQGTFNSNKYLEFLGLPPKNNVLSQIAKDIKKNKTDTRYYSGKETNVDILFDEYIVSLIKKYKTVFKEDPFKEFSILTYLYHIDCKRKTTLELIKEMYISKDIETKSQIREILLNRKLSKENMISDIKELILNDNEELREYKEIMLSRFNKLLTTKEKSMLLTRLKILSLGLKNTMSEILYFMTELNESEIESNNILVDNLSDPHLQKKNKPIDKED